MENGIEKKRMMKHQWNGLTSNDLKQESLVCAYSYEISESKKKQKLFKEICF